MLAYRQSIPQELGAPIEELLAIFPSNPLYHDHNIIDYCKNNKYQLKCLTDESSKSTTCTTDYNQKSKVKNTRCKILLSFTFLVKSRSHPSKHFNTHTTRRTSQCPSECTIQHFYHTIPFHALRYSCNCSYQSHQEAQECQPQTSTEPYRKSPDQAHSK